MNYIRWFEEVGAADVGLVGGKGANLGEMAVAGLPVPPGFCLTAAAYRNFIQATGLDETIRRLLLELGHRWRVRGLIAQPDDAFFLRLEELEEVAESPRTMHAEVRARRAEFETNKRRAWPNIIRGNQEIYAEGVESAEASGGQLRGIAGSPGVITGVARVIRGPEEFDKLRNGEILVAPLTNPVWTPLFALAGGVVTEVGGILSHGAIVARECGIPAVMGVAGATTLVQGGQPLTVDGNKGIVYLQ